jgi:deazaflavin-dependent oxidoreductase (nitroreductase family)
MTTRRPAPERDPWPAWLNQLQIRYMNPLFWQLAPYLPGFALLEHTGRSSGHAYRTPVNAFTRNGQMVFGLGHGRSSWVKNLLAADGADVRRLGRRHRMSNPRLVTIDEPKHGLPLPMRIVGRRLELLVADIDNT